MAIAAFCLLATTVAVAADDAGTSGLAGQGTPTEGLGSDYSETGFGRIGARPDGGLVVQREGQLESFLASGSPDSAAPPRDLPKYSSWFPLASGKSLVLDEAKLTRLDPDGSVDTGFGGGAPIEAPYDTAAATELPSGKIVLAGTGSGGTHETFYFVNVELVGADGSVGRSAGGSAGLQLSLPGDGGGVAEIAPTPDGGALVVGGDFLLELRADGTPNPAFGADGLVIHRGLELAGGRVLPDGSIEAVGTAHGHSGKDLAYLRLTAAGAADPAYATEGSSLFDFGGEEEAHVASWAADGSVVVGGATQPPGTCFGAAGCDEEPILVAFDPAGNLDKDFGSGGVLRLIALSGSADSLTSGGVSSLVRRPDGSLVAAGSAPPEGTTAFLAALSPAGALLPGFGEGGIVRERRSTPAMQTIAGLVPLSDGGMLAAGVSDVGVENTPVLIRYGADGSLDRSFGGGAGYTVFGKAGFVNGFAVDRSGHLLTTLYGYPRAKLVELRTADGARESSFGSDGLVLLPSRVFADAVGFAAEGGAIVVGTDDVGSEAEPGVVLRYHRNGKPDREFGTDGRVDLLTPGGEEVTARAVASDLGDRTLVAGVSHRRLALGRLLGDGRPDPRFGSGGWALVSTDGTPLASRGGVTRAVALDVVGPHVYLAGVTREEGRLRLVLLRFDADGRLDQSFGQGGRRTASIPKAAEPTAIVPTGRRVLVVLNGGPKPLVSFDRGGVVRQQPVGRPGLSARNVRATVSSGRLLLGWSGLLPATRSDVYYLGARPLGGR